MRTDGEREGWEVSEATDMRGWTEHKRPYMLGCGESSGGCWVTVLACKVVRAEAEQGLPFTDSRIPIPNMLRSSQCDTMLGNG